MLTKFMKILKIKLPVFIGFESEEAYVLILDCYKRFHKLALFVIMG